MFLGDGIFVVLIILVEYMYIYLLVKEQYWEHALKIMVMELRYIFSKETFLGSSKM